MELVDRKPRSQHFKNCINSSFFGRFGLSPFFLPVITFRCSPVPASRLTVISLLQFLLAERSGHAERQALLNLMQVDPQKLCPEFLFFFTLYCDLLYMAFL